MTKTNLEHYKKELKEIYTFNYNNPRGVIKKIEERFGCQIKLKSGEHLTDSILEWMSQPYKEPILNDTEREYLAATIKPFRKMIAYIVKAQDFDDGKQCIRIILQNGDGMHFPYLDDDAMYKGMEVNKEYSLEELGL